MKNVRLKATIFEKGITQQDLSKVTGIPSSYISLAIRGRLNLSADEQNRIAKALNCKSEELFES